MGYQVAERMLPREALYSANEVFLTGTGAEITPDRIPIGALGAGRLPERSTRSTSALPRPS